MLAVTVGAGGGVRAEDIHVPADTPTIQMAIDEAGAGDRIIVAPGTYFEDLLIPLGLDDLELTSSAGLAVTTITGVATTAAGEPAFAHPALAIHASGVAVHGFTFRAPPTPPDTRWGGIVVGGDDVAIFDNTLKVPSGFDPGLRSRGIQTYPAAANPGGGNLDGLHVFDNTFTSVGTGPSGYAALVVNDAAGPFASLLDVRIEDNTIVGRVGVGIAAARSKMRIEGNTIQTTLSPATPLAHRGLQLAPPGNGLQRDVTVARNTVGGLGPSAGFETGIRLGDEGGSRLRAVQMHDNTIGSNAVGIAIDALVPSAQDILITRNEITGNTLDGVLVAAASSVDGVTIMRNTITGNGSYGVRNASSEPLDATDNWWGDPSGPLDPDGLFEAEMGTCFDPQEMANADGLGDRVSDGAVDYCPWRPSVGPCALACPPATSVTLDADCTGLVPDLAMLALADCGPPPPTTITQSPPAGFVVTDPGVVAVILTAASGDGRVTESCVVMLTFTDETAPDFLTTPAGGVACVGGTFQFTTAAEDGCGPVSYQWIKDGLDLPDATADTLTFGSITPADAGLYAVRVADGSGNESVSEPALLEVGDGVAVEIVAEPASLPCPGATATLTAVVDGGTGVVTYAWSTGAETASIDVDEPGDYSVTVNDDTGCMATTTYELAAGLDVTPPALECPADVSVSCDASTSPNATGTAEAVDGCDPDPSVTFADEIVSGSCGERFTIVRTWSAMDGAGNLTECTQLIEVDDTVAPVVQQGTIASCHESPDEARLAALDATTAHDDCSLVSVEASVVVEGCVAVVTVTAIDACGNEASVEYLTAVDTGGLEVITPAELMQPADAGGCDAFVVVPPLDVAASCGEVAITNDYTGTDDASATYAAGETAVLWTATDACGNVRTTTQVITVLEVNPVTVSIELKNVLEVEATRCITFEFYGCDDETPIVVEQDVEFVAGLALDLPMDIPCGAYICVTARDTLHTLRRSDDDQFGIAPIVGTQYVADFTDHSASGGDDDGLIGGNVNDDDFIEVLDFALFVIRFGQSVGQTTCLTPGPHPDFSGDGRVFSEDFSFIQINYLATSDQRCCPPEGVTEPMPLPPSSWSRAALRHDGIGHLIGADLDGNDRIDAADVRLFAGGARPARRVRSPRNGGRWEAPGVWGDSETPDPTTDVDVRGPLVLEGAATAASVFVHSGAVLLVEGGVLRAKTLEVAPGGTLLIAGRDARVEVESMWLSPAAEVVVEAGLVVHAGNVYPPAHIDRLRRVTSE
ncbi:MAG: hypothetical protein HKO59_11935 [Phycisphaerales bacterium]|nr:hypothetical protein [Phycisphaerales bacterium]